jgi:glutamine synthetase
MHEKPFKGINGSGKHNNWSIGTDTGINLLKPGENPSDNLQFIAFFVNTIKAVHDHADLLRASIASAGNDHRLGANEAPPAIVSVFIGSTLTEVLKSFEKGLKHKGDSNPSIDVNRIPEILRDDTDRNRTSPFAFTGNKFEFRAVGSDQNCASSMTVLNTIVGNQLIEFKAEVDALIADKVKKEEAIRTVIKKYIKKSKKVLFEGNGYGEEWVKIAEKRGLSNIKTTPHALGSYLSKSSKKVFVSNDILTATNVSKHISY